jgi:acyl transferase domain-containing protein
MPEIAFMIETVSSSRLYQLLLLSAKTKSALDDATAKLAEYLKHDADIKLADAAYTLQTGYEARDYRRMVVGRSREDALAILEAHDATQVLSAERHVPERPITFMFSGVGDHYAGMAQDLYATERLFREQVDRCCALLTPQLGRDLKDVLYPTSDATTPVESGIDLRAMLGRRGRAPAAQLLNQTALAQPAVFVIEYALAQLLMHWGIRPQAMIGYSLGEYVAACLAGVLSLEDALMLVSRRAHMIQDLPEGAMLAVALSEAQARPLLGEKLSLATINGPSMCVVSGAVPAIEALAEQLGQQGVACWRLGTSHAFHSNMMNPLREPVTALAHSIKLHPPQIRYVSNITGTWITPAQATAPAYWAQHMCETVRFSDGLSTLLHDSEQVLLEIGAGQSLGSFAKQHPDCVGERALLVLPTLRYKYDRQSDVAFLLGTLGKLWLMGTTVNWNGFYADEHRRRVPLPISA